MPRKVKKEHFFGQLLLLFMKYICCCVLGKINLGPFQTSISVITKQKYLHAFSNICIKMWVIHNYQRGEFPSCFWCVTPVLMHHYLRSLSLVCNGSSGGQPNSKTVAPQNSDNVTAKNKNKSIWPWLHTKLKHKQKFFDLDRIRQIRKLCLVN